MKFETVDIFKLAGLIVLLVVLVVVVALGWIQLVQPEKTVEGDMQTTTRTAQPDEPDTMLPDDGDEIGPVPELPASDIPLDVDTDTGTAYSPDGEKIYELSGDRSVWVPVVPQDMVDMLGDRVPSIDPSGNWVIISADGKDRYIWDSETASWEPLGDDVAVEHGEGTEAAPDEATETAATQAVPTQTTTEEAQAAEPPAATQAAADEPASSQDQAPEDDVPQPPVIPTATPGLPVTHTLRGGEFVYCIARRYNVDPGELLRINGITSNSLLRGGTVLKIPQTGSPFPGRRALQPHPDTYTVEAGDSIYSIACAYGDVDPWAIAYANQLEAPYALIPGMVLYIP